MSYHRYQSISDPINYRNEQQDGGSKKFKAAIAIFKCIAVGWSFSIPTFFEPAIVFNTHEYWEMDEEIGSIYVSSKKPFIALSTTS